VGVVRVTWAISTLWTYQVVGRQVIYTTQRRRFVYDTWDNGSRLYRVMVECTLSMTHCIQLNLQLHTIDLVRTCRINSFCTVAWQLARFELTRRIARSLGDSWASCIQENFVWNVIDYVLLPLQPDHYKQHRRTKNDQSQNVVRHIALTCAVPATKVIRHLPCLSYRRRRHWELMHSEVMSLLFTESFARALYQGLHN